MSNESPVLIFSRELSLHNFPPPVTRVASRELSVANVTEDASTGNVFSRELSLVNFPIPVVLAFSREFSLNSPVAVEPLNSIWSREASLNNFPTGITTAFSREFSLGQWAEANTTENVWSRESSVGNRFITATAALVENGSYLSGNVASLKEVDADQYLVKGLLGHSPPSGRPGEAFDPISIRFEFSSDIAFPDNVEFQFYGRVDRSDVQWLVDFYDWSQHKFVPVFSGPASQTDTRVSVSRTASEGNFVDPVNSTIRARIHTRATKDQKTLTRILLDQVLFVVRR